ncbi:NPCBM/NEW2 domain-containing protein [Deinococcus sp. QL22]|uniref:NPCBM/NEW2 domain-containing protein n=1 Tax=Deinococcus sp. QL22 TaxID=2939437 RepID=UPI002017DACB|nr:NPCBM/NEW2 domain-containing protein [Deinococcus sp. QL22]UQN10823.1 NPCBM/NEW2 domain-containing protein [Deinococcus sp. QL22]
MMHRVVARSLLVGSALTLALTACGQSPSSVTADPYAGGVSYPWAYTASPNQLTPLSLTAGENNLYYEPILAARNSWGPIEIDRSNGEQQAGDGKTLTLNGITYARGFGTHAGSELRFSLKGTDATCTRFTSQIGIDDEVGSKGSVVFQVYLDGQKAYDSGTMTGASATKTIDLDITGKQELRLVVTDAGDNIHYDHADWAKPLVFCQTSVPPASSTLERMSLSNDGSEGNEDSYDSSISANGRLVAFVSTASNLVPGDTNTQTDVFVHNIQAGTTTRASVANDGSQSNGYALNPSISVDGRWVVFVSNASNLVPGDTNGHRDVFVRDLQAGTTTRVSLANDGSQSNSGSFNFNSSISADGRLIAFSSFASNLVPGDTNGDRDVFVRDLQAGTTTRVSLANDGSQSNGFSDQSSISADGRWVVFNSYASNLISSDTNNQSDVFMRNLQTGTTTRISLANDGSQSNNLSDQPSISADGRWVAFNSFASNLIPNDTNGATDVFVRDLQAGTTTRVSLTNDGAQSTGFSDKPVISSDGRWVAFNSDANNFVPGDTNGATDVFVRDLQMSTTTRINVKRDGLQSTGLTLQPSISADGHSVAFYSDADDLVPGDTNGTFDVFRWHRP